MIVAAAVKLTDNTVYVGRRHSDCFASIVQIWTPKVGYENARKIHFNCIQGFITDSLQFLTREQAYAEALACGQIERKDDKTLYSEDLW